MTSLKLIAPDAAVAASLESDVTSTIYEKLAEYGYKPTAVVSADASANVRHLHPDGNLWTEQEGSQIEIKLHNVDVDKKDLFTAVLADLEQRIDGLTGEID